MRAILINIQVMIILIMIFITVMAAVMAGGGLVSMAALGAGFGPAALGAGVFILMLFVGAIIGFAAVVLPIALLAAFTLLFAILSGYRHLRWTRFAGIAVNAVFALIIIGLYCFSETKGAVLLMPLLVFPLINGCLFLFLPRRPNHSLTEKFTYCAIPVFHTIPLLIIVLEIIANPPGFDAGDSLFLGILFLLYTLPFYFNFRTIPATRTLNRRLAFRLAISLAMTVLALIFVFPLGLPLCFTTLLLFELAEFAVFRPAFVPEPDSVHYWLARTLGQLPDTADMVDTTELASAP